MNKDNAKFFLPLVQALADGKTIQVNDRGGKGWVDASRPAFNLPSDLYRVKPEKIKLNLYRTRHTNEYWAGPGPSYKGFETHHEFIKEIEIEV